MSRGHGGDGMRFWVSMSCATILASALVGQAIAGPALDWDPLFTWEPGGSATNSPAGDTLSGVGFVSKFDTPLAFLDASDPTKEYTIFIGSLLSSGTVISGGGSFTFYETHYTGGVIEVYEDLSPDAVVGVNPPNATAPSKFRDGTLILSGVFTRFLTQTNNFTVHKTGNMEGDILWTGGLYQNLMVDGAGRPCPGLFTGGVTWEAGVVPQGYIFRHDGKIDNNCPVATDRSTWGGVKGTYR